MRAKCTTTFFTVIIATRHLKLAIICHNLFTAIFVLENFNDLLCPAIQGFVEGRVRYPRFFQGFHFRGTESASAMLQDILNWIGNNNLTKLYILIDEYDNFTNQLLTADKDPLYEEVTTGESFLRTDIGWIRRLTITQENAKEMLDALVVDDELIYSLPDLRSKFNKQKFFDKQFYPISLYYLGMTTLKNIFKMRLPNMTMRSIYMTYYNEMNCISDDARRFVPVYEHFIDDRLLEPLIKNYFQEYLGQFPAQVFDKMNENFIRRSFYEVLIRYLSSSYTFSLEQNLPAERADLVLTGIPGTSFHNDCRVVEFKYFKAKDAGKIKALTHPEPEDVEQVKAYAADINRRFTDYRMKSYVVYIAAGKVCRIWKVYSFGKKIGARCLCLSFTSTD